MGERIQFLRDMAMAAWRRRKALEAIALALATWILLTASAAHLLERDDQPETFGSWWACVYWAVITVTTVGYGDMAPVTAGGRIVAAVTAVVGVGLLLIAVSILARAFSEKMDFIGK